MNILMIVTGSISCNLYEKIYDKLSEENNVKMLFTKSAYDILSETYTYKNHKFEKPMTIAEETKKYLFTKKVEHIELINWADKMLIAPCTANTLNKINQGVADDFVTTTILAFLGTWKPTYIAPAMNTNMWSNFAVKRSIRELSKYIHVTFIQPTVKELACGDVGIGALAYVGTIVNIVNEHRWNFPIQRQDLNGIDVRMNYEDFGDYIPTFQEPGSFGFKRKHEIHNGVDIYCKDGCDVFAVEDGIVIDIKPFTGKQNGTDWWNDTWAICIKGKSGVVCYGEMEENFNFSIGDSIKVNDCIGNIKAVLPEYKIRKDIRHHNNAMLHIQLFKDYENDEQLADWYPNQERNKFLLDPTPYLNLC